MSNISDHSPVSIEFRYNNTKSYKNHDYWKCNSKILKDEYFQYDFQRLWLRMNTFEDKTAEWRDNCKLNFRSLLIAHSQRISYANDREIIDLKAQIYSLSNCDLFSLEIRQRKIGILQDKLEFLTADKLEGAKLRSKKKYLQLYEKPSKYFLRTEKRRATNKTINMLSTDEG